MLAIWNFAHVLTAAVYITWRGLKVRMEKFAKWCRKLILAPKFCNWNFWSTLLELKRIKSWRVSTATPLRKGMIIIHPEMRVMIGFKLSVSVNNGAHSYLFICCVEFCQGRQQPSRPDESTRLVQHPKGNTTRQTDCHNLRHKYRKIPVYNV